MTQAETGANMVSMAKDRYQDIKQKWKKEHMKLYNFRLIRASESDMIEHLEKNKPIQAYIKGLIRADMENKTDQN